MTKETTQWVDEPFNHFKTKENFEHPPSSSHIPSLE